MWQMRIAEVVASDMLTGKTGASTALLSATYRVYHNQYPETIAQRDSGISLSSGS